MGVGKGSTARAYSKKYNSFIIDTDDLIESKENREIKKIFKKNGENSFRFLEQDCANWIEKSVDNTLISCGGGFYKVKNLKKLGKIILLDASFNWIYNRLLTANNSKEKIKKRPLFSEPKKAEELYNQREEDYRKIADFVLNVEGKERNDIAKEIYKLVYI